jgi:uncharacterized membrane protein
MKIFGHPLHIMLIHFPAALLPMDIVCSIIGFYNGSSSFAACSFYSMCGGVLMGWLALVTGTFDLIGIIENKPASIKKALIHGIINTVVIIIYTLLLYIRYKSNSAFIQDPVVTMIIKAATVLLMLVGNYMGGNLILKDKIGVNG